MSHSDLWPDTDFPLSAAESNRLLNQLEPVFAGQLALEQLPTSLTAELPRLYLPLAAWLNQQRPGQGPLMVGLNGSQGSGKSTLCNLLKWILEAAFDCRTCVISIDDLYLKKATRQQLAAEVHPLLATRGVPGTHDIPLGLELFAQLKAAATGTSVAIPRFNKASDDRRPQEEWDHCDGPVDLVLFEGWCVGATPQSEAELEKPLNRLEEREDGAGSWRQYVNAQLEGPYRELFAQLETLLMLQIPDWELVYHWRKRQEQQLAAKSSGAGIMGDTELRRFIMHYERLTRHQLQELPKRADLVMALDAQQRVTTLRLN
jgi:D-glycerate 3-kinase